MPPGKRVKILVPDVSPELRDRVDGFARARDLSRNAVALGALEERYGLEPSETTGGYREPWQSDNGPWSIEVPVRVRTKLRQEAARRGATISGIVRATLQEKFGLEVEALVARRIKGPS